ncbi:MAG: class I SAM-dependent methyltransferase [Lachnospiraceae bacterium]|nr:class I SAM-dependent methyltransferase [Lachnospiraceae bacterium]
MDNDFLKKTEDGLIITDGEQQLRGDFTKMLPRLKYNNLTHELLVKAVKIKNFEGTLNVLDATAGMGEDSLLLAAAGFNVSLFERDSVIAALLRDTIERSAEILELREIVGRMHLREADSIKVMTAMAENPDDEICRGIPKPDVIVLDPMFPARKKSALVKKKFQVLHQLEAPCPDEEELIQAAVLLKPRKIVIKRPAKGPYLAGIKPSYSLDGKAIRYDCIMLT